MVFEVSLSFMSIKLNHQARKALEPVAAALEEGGLGEEEALAAAAALADLGVKTPADLADVDEKYVRQAADAAGLKPIRADKLVKVVKSRAASPKERAPSAVAAHLIDDFKMNAKVKPASKARLLIRCSCSSYYSPHTCSCFSSEGGGASGSSRGR